VCVSSKRAVLTSFIGQRIRHCGRDATTASVSVRAVEQLERSCQRLFGTGSRLADDPPNISCGSHRCHDGSDYNESKWKDDVTEYVCMCACVSASINRCPVAGVCTSPWGEGMLHWGISRLTAFLVCLVQGWRSRSEIQENDDLFLMRRRLAVPVGLVLDLA
jgi:hypothetical protein